MSFLEANQRTIDAIRKADKINIEDSSTITTAGSETSFNFYDTSTPPTDDATTPVSGALQLEGQFVPIMSGNNFYCTMRLPSLGVQTITAYAGDAINGQITCRTASFRPNGDYIIEACFAYTSEGWVGSGTYGSDQDFRHSWMLATSGLIFPTGHKSGGGVYYEPICYLLSGVDGYSIIPLRWGGPIELKGVWT